MLNTKQHYFSKNKQYKIIAIAILIIIFIYLLWQYTFVFYENNFSGYVDRPFVYRQFVPQMALFLSVISPIQLNNAVVVVIILSAIGFTVSLRHLYLAFWKKSFYTEVFTLLSGILVLILFMFERKVYDLSTAFFITLALNLLARKNFKAFYLLYPLSCLNRETTFLLTLLFIVYYYKKLSIRNYVFGLIYQVITYLLIRLFLMYIFRNNPGFPLYYRLIDNFHLHYSEPMNTIILAAVVLIVFIFVAYRWNTKPEFLRVSLQVFFPVLFILYVFLGGSFELRVFIEVYPILMLLLWPIIGEKMNLDFSS